MATSDFFTVEPGPSSSAANGGGDGDGGGGGDSGGAPARPGQPGAPAAGRTAVAEAAAAGRTATSVVQPGSPVRTLFTLFLKMQLTRTRVIGLGLAGLAGVLVALAL